MAEFRSWSEIPALMGRQMRYKKFAVTALLAAAATGVTASTVYAAPVPAPPVTEVITDLPSSASAST